MIMHFIIKPWRQQAKYRLGFYKKYKTFLVQSQK